MDPWLVPTPKVRRWRRYCVTVDPQYPRIPMPTADNSFKLVLLFNPYFSHLEYMKGTQPPVQSHEGGSLQHIYCTLLILCSEYFVVLGRARFLRVSPILLLVRALALLPRRRAGCSTLGPKNGQAAAQKPTGLMCVCVHSELPHHTLFLLTLMG